MEAGLRLGGLESGDMMLFPRLPRVWIHAVAFIRPFFLWGLRYHNLLFRNSKSSFIIGNAGLNCKVASFSG